MLTCSLSCQVTHPHLVNPSEVIIPMTDSSSSQKILVQTFASSDLGQRRFSAVHFLLHGAALGKRQIYNVAFRLREKQCGECKNDARWRKI